ncbi:MAG: GTPase Era [Clostridia bacterium]|nr:GTPase Era [Clostridia bacterium]
MSQTKSAFITLIGRPNVGKSTLLNALIGTKVSIVSPKPQTTRNRVTGILTEGDTQLVFLDTPGVHKSKSKLGDYMVKVAEESAKETDVTVMVIESGDVVRPAEERIAKKLKGKTVLVINKIDLKPKEEILKTIAAFSALHSFDEIVPISAYKKDGVDILRKILIDFATPAPFYYDDDQVTDMNEYEMISEMAREKLLYLLGEEVPHGTAVQLTTLEKSESLVRVGITIYCERDSHKAIIIGKGGQSLRKIGEAIRKELEFTYDCKVFLDCFVKVKKDWRNDLSALDDLGYKN